MCGICCDIVDGDYSPIRFFQKVDAPQKRGLSGTAGTDDRNNLTAFHLETDIFQNLLVSKRLFQMFDL